MDVIRAALEASPLAALFLTIAAGYLIRDQQRNRVPTPSTIIAADQVLLLVGTDPAAIDKAPCLP